MKLLGWAFVIALVLVVVGFVGLYLLALYVGRRFEEEK